MVNQFFVWLFPVDQDRGQSGGDGSDAGVQEDSSSERKTRGYMQEGAVAPQRDLEGRSGRHARVSAPVSQSQVELHDRQEVLAKDSSTW